MRLPFPVMAVVTVHNQVAGVECNLAAEELAVRRIERRLAGSLSELAFELIDVAIERQRTGVVEIPGFAG